MVPPQPQQPWETPTKISWLPLFVVISMIHVQSLGKLRPSPTHQKYDLLVIINGSCHLLREQPRHAKSAVFPNPWHGVHPLRIFSCPVSRPTRSQGTCFPLGIAHHPSSIFVFLILFINLLLFLFSLILGHHLTKYDKPPDKVLFFCEVFCYILIPWIVYQHPLVTFCNCVTCLSPSVVISTTIMTLLNNTQQSNR